MESRFSWTFQPAPRGARISNVEMARLQEALSQAKVVQNGRTIRRMAPGDFFGEVSLLDPGPRTATVVADTPTVCLNLAGGDFRDILAGEPTLSLKVVRVLARRLRDAQGRRTPA
jgi:CRP-like cAMP-binding protein